MSRRTTIAVMLGLLTIGTAATFSAKQRFNWSWFDNRLGAGYTLEYSREGWLFGWLERRELVYKPFSNPDASRREVLASLIRAFAVTANVQGLDPRARELVACARELATDPNNYNPFKVNWTLFGFDCVLLLAIWVAVVMLATHVHAFVLRRERVRRIRQGACVVCGYDLTGNESGVCPECGERI